MARTLADLLNSSSKQVLHNVAANPHTPNKSLNSIIKDEDKRFDSEIKAAAEENLNRDVNYRPHYKFEKEPKYTIFYDR